MAVIARYRLIGRCRIHRMGCRGAEDARSHGRELCRHPSCDAEVSYRCGTDLTVFDGLEGQCRREWMHYFLQLLRTAWLEWQRLSYARLHSHVSERHFGADRRELRTIVCKKFDVLLVPAVFPALLS